MFSFNSINTGEVNASSQPPQGPVLSINASEDINTLSWTSPVFTDFFSVYWSNDPFTSVSEPGVHVIVSPVGITTDPLATISYNHAIPAAFDLFVLYYRVSAYNSNGVSLSNQDSRLPDTNSAGELISGLSPTTLSNQEDSYNFRLAIYEDLYNATLEELTLRFTPEIRRQYQDSILWKSFVQSLCSELARGRFEIKEALKQLNLQKAIDVFLNLWNNITGIARQNKFNYSTGVDEIETDAEYRARMVDNIFWDKISNLAMKKTLLLKLGYDGDAYDSGISSTDYRDVPATGPWISPNSKLLSNIYGLSIGSAILPDDELNDIYNTISSMAALGNVLIEILQDLTVSFEDWDILFGNIPYSEIFVGNTTYSAIDKSTESNWTVDEKLYLDNQWTMEDSKKFDGNAGPDDIVVLTRNT